MKKTIYALMVGANHYGSESHTVLAAYGTREEADQMKAMIDVCNPKRSVEVVEAPFYSEARERVVQDMGHSNLFPEVRKPSFFGVGVANREQPIEHQQI